MTKSDLKLVFRYFLILFFVYMSWMVVSPEYIMQMEGVSKEIIIAINISVFGALTLILNKHFETKPSD